MSAKITHIFTRFRSSELINYSRRESRISIWREGRKSRPEKAENESGVLGERQPALSPPARQSGGAL